MNPWIRISFRSGTKTDSRRKSFEFFLLSYTLVIGMVLYCSVRWPRTRIEDGTPAYDSINVERHPSGCAFGEYPSDNSWNGQMRFHLRAIGHVRSTRTVSAVARIFRIRCDPFPIRRSSAIQKHYRASFACNTRPDRWVSITTTIAAATTIRENLNSFSHKTHKI